MAFQQNNSQNSLTRVLVILIAAVLVLIVLRLAGCIGGEPDSADEMASAETSTEAQIASTDAQASTDQSGASGQADASLNPTSISSVGSTAASDAQASATPADYANIDESALQNLLGKKVTKALMKKAQTNEDAAWIAANYQSYEQYGQDQQVKLLTLAPKETQALTFVRNYTESETEASAGCDTLRSGAMPELYQWDTRWAWVKYSEHCIGTSGCGVTALAMVYQGLTGDTSKSPYDLSVDSVENDYVHSGTDPDFYAFEAEKLGLTCEEVSVSSSNLKSALKKGSIVIINMGPGDFTTGGHYIVAYAVDGLGKLHVRDPYSAVNTAKTWDLDSVVSQAKRLFVFSK